MKNLSTGKVSVPRFGLKRQAALAGVVMVIGLAAATAVTCGLQRTIYAAAERAAKLDIPEAGWTQQVASQASRCLDAQAAFEAAEAAPEPQREAIESWHQAYHTLEQLLGNVPPGISDETRSRIAAWRKLAGSYQRSFLAAANGGKTGKSLPGDDARDALGKSRTAIQAIATQAGHWAFQQTDGCKTAARELQQLAGTQLQLMTLRSVVALLMVATAWLWLSRTVLNRIAVFSAALCRFTGGHYSTRIAGSGRDEIGVLGGQFNEMASTVQRNQQELQRARDAALAENRAKNGSLAAFRERLSERLQIIYDCASGMPPEIDDPSRRRAADTIRQTSESLLEVVRHLPDLSKIEWERLEAVPCSPREVMAETCSASQRQVEEKEPMPDVAEEPVAHASQIATGCRILLAEDGPENQRLMTFILKRAGAEVETVTNGQDVLRKVLPQAEESKYPEPAQPFDAILMDLDMPVMNGCEATHRLRESGYDGLVIAVTGHGDRYDRDHCLTSGFDDYLAKPIDHLGLLRMLVKHSVLAKAPAGVAAG